MVQSTLVPNRGVPILFEKRAAVNLSGLHNQRRPKLENVF